MAPTDDDDPDWDEDVEWRDRRRGREARTATSWQGGTGPMPTFVAIAALVVSLVALAITLLNRPAQPGACRTAAWAAVPAAADLPAGWQLGSTDLNANGMTISILGPADPQGQGSAPVVYASVTCFGDEAGTAMDRNRAAARAGGATIIDGPLGEQAFEVSQPTGTSSTYIRLGGLIGQVADAGAASPNELDQITTAVARAMGDRTAAAGGGPDASSGTRPSGSSAEPTDSADLGSDEPPASSTPFAPELVAAMPKSIDDTPLTVGDVKDRFGLDPGSRAFLSVLRSLGASTDDLQVAEAFDETQQLDLDAIGFRLPGLELAKLRSAIIDTWLSGSATGVVRTEVTLSGKKLTKIDFGDQGTTEYVFTGSDHIIVIDTKDPTIAEKAAAQLR
jgi:hypothetical protein